MHRRRLELRGRCRFFATHLEQGGGVFAWLLGPRLLKEPEVGVDGNGAAGGLFIFLT